MSGLQKSKMELLWEKLPKNKDGITITYIAADLPYLYNSGFVDSQTFTLQQWQNAFEPYKTADGKFVLNRDQFLKLGVFRYNAPLGEIYDPLKLREGSWPDYELAYLWYSSIRTSSTISFDLFTDAVNALKKSGKTDSEGQLVIDTEVKKQLSYLLDKFPSPKRKLQKEVERLREKRGQTLAKVQKSRDSSSFTVGQTQMEARKAKLSDLESSGTAKPTTTPAPKFNKDAAGLDLKTLKKPGSKFRG